MTFEEAKKNSRSHTRSLGKMRTSIYGKVQSKDSPYQGKAQILNTPSGHEEANVEFVVGDYSIDMKAKSKSIKELKVEQSFW